MGKINWGYQCFIFRSAPVFGSKHRRTEAGPPKKKAVSEEDCRQAEAAFEKFDSGKADFKGSKKGEQEHRITKRDYVSYIGTVEKFKRHLYRCALRNGYGCYEETVLLSDGAAWIANMAEEMFPDACHILNLFHLKENVYGFARNKFGADETKYVPWAERICKLPEGGKSGDVLKELNPGENYSNCVNLYHYITMRREHINYPQYKKKDIFVGAGRRKAGTKWYCKKD